MTPGTLSEPGVTPYEQHSIISRLSILRTSATEEASTEADISSPIRFTWDEDAHRRSAQQPARCDRHRQNELLIGTPPSIFKAKKL